MSQPLTQSDKTRRGAEDAGRYFRYMAEFVGFTDADAEAIRQSGLIIEKHIPSIVSQFYEHLLRYPPTREHFLRKDGSLDRDYLQLRMHHLSNFWRRTAGGVYDDDYARYVDYVGRAHTSHGADPNIYIAERYVIGQVGFMQHAINEAIVKELHEFDPDLEQRAMRAWNLLMMVILELLARAYGEEHEGEMDHTPLTVDPRSMLALAVDTYERGLGLTREVQYKDLIVGQVSEIPEGERKLVQVDEFSIGVFHHKSGWYAVRNSCLHRGGPVATGTLVGDVLTCPWHGYQYDLTSGKLLVDPSSKLETFPVTLVGEEVHLRVPDLVPGKVERDLETGSAPAPVAVRAALKENEIYASDLQPGMVVKLRLNDTDVALYNVDGQFYATQEKCTHAGGPLSEGELDGQVITCPWHGSCFDVTDGQVKCRPAVKPIKTFRAVLDGEIVRVQQ